MLCVWSHLGWHSFLSVPESLCSTTVGAQICSLAGLCYSSLSPSSLAELGCDFRAFPVHESRSHLSEWPCSWCGSHRPSCGTGSVRLLGLQAILSIGPGAPVCCAGGSITPAPLPRPLPVMQQKDLNFHSEIPQADSDKCTCLPKPLLPTALQWGHM